jgi:hypothetical protein
MLTPEDTLRLNVLISTCVAIRIDIYKLVVVGLTELVGIGGTPPN